jgi:hypothetical protein
MASRRRRLDPVGPFGNPDGSRADIEDVISEFVDFGGNPAYGHLATRANDSMVRVIVGKLGAGKTVYLRRLQDFQSRQDSVYADVPQQSLPKTEVVVKACQWFSDSEAPVAPRPTASPNPVSGVSADFRAATSAPLCLDWILLLPGVLPGVRSFFQGRYRRRTWPGRGSLPVSGLMGMSEMTGSNQPR